MKTVIYQKKMMNLKIMSNYLKEYAELSAQIDMLNEKRDALKNKVKQQVIDLGGKYEIDFVRFSIRNIKKWSYPQYVLDAEENYKAEKAKAEELEEATCEVSQSLTFTLNKI